MGSFRVSLRSYIHTYLTETRPTQTLQDDHDKEGGVTSRFEFSTTPPSPDGAAAAPAAAPSGNDSVASGGEGSTVGGGGAAVGGGEIAPSDGLYVGFFFMQVGVCMRVGGVGVGVCMHACPVRVVLFRHYTYDLY